MENIKQIQWYECGKCNHKFTEEEMVTKRSPGSNCCDIDYSWHCPKCDSKSFVYL